MYLKRYIFILLVVSGVIAFLWYFGSVRPYTVSIQGTPQKQRPISITPSVTASPAVSVTMQKTNIMRGVALNPIQNQSLETNSTTIQNYVKNIAQLGANTISLYNCGLYDWNNLRNVPSAKSFCDKVYAYAQTENLQVIPGYFSNTTQDWELPETAARATDQFQDLVATTKHFSFIHYYLIGNEIFEKLPNMQAKNNYARWIAKMSVWLAAHAPEKEIIYADNVNLVALPYLQKYEARLTTYAINDYEWGSAHDLVKKINEIQQKVPGVHVLLHEWGVDSFEVSTMKEDQAKQSARIVYLAKEIEKAALQFQGVFMGSVLFSFTDDLSKLGNPTTRDQDAGQAWVCTTCFDNKANEEFWGIYQKTAYESLKSYWSTLPTSDSNK